MFFRKDLEIIPWSYIEAFDDVNDIWGIWKDLFLGVCDKHATHTKIRVSGEKTEWLTDEYIGMAYESDDLKQKAEKMKDPELWTKYKEMRNKVNNYKEQLKKVLSRENIRA